MCSPSSSVFEDWLLLLDLPPLRSMTNDSPSISWNPDGGKCFALMKRARIHSRASAKKKAATFKMIQPGQNVIAE